MTKQPMPFTTSTIEALLEDVQQGKMVILVDDEDRENEGDLVMAASMVTPEDVNFMARQGRGLICLTLTPERCNQLSLPLMVPSNGSRNHTNFTLSIEATEGVSTGISAKDRAHTIRTAVAAHAKPADLVQPGHVFPLRAVPGGVLRRAGHTEAGCDLMRLAGVEPSAVIVEIMNEDGTMARRQDLERFAAQFELKIGTIADLIYYRRLHETTITPGPIMALPTRFGEFAGHFFDDLVTGEQHIALVKGSPKDADAPPVRVHIGSFSKDLLQVISAQTHPNAEQWCLSSALSYIQTQPSGVVVLLGRTVQAQDLYGQCQQLLATQESLGSTIEHHHANIGTGAQILRSLGLNKLTVLSSKMKFNAISGFGLEIVQYLERVPTR